MEWLGGQTGIGLDPATNGPVKEVEYSQCEGRIPLFSGLFGSTDDLGDGNPRGPTTMEEFVDGRPLLASSWNSRK